MKHIADQFALPLALPPVQIDCSSSLPKSHYQIDWSHPQTAVAIKAMEAGLGGGSIVLQPGTAALPPAKKHHKYGPSRLGYLDECSGFTSRDGTNAAAEEGTALHEHMEMLLRIALRENISTCEALNTKSGNWDFTDEEREYLRFCCKRCDIYLAKKPTQVLTEISVTVTGPDGKEMNHGTLDVAFIWPTIAIVVDFKFGWVPVKQASKNLQGMNYALGVFQKFPQLNAVGVEFDQPKLNWFSTTSYQRVQMADMFQRCSDVINRAEFVQDHPDQAQPFMKPGNYCQYCALAGGCSVLSNYRALAATKFNDLPAPVQFKGLQITSVSDIALARYWVDIIEAGVKEIKQRANEMAEANGGEISCTLPNGEVIIYAMAEKNADRSLGSPIEISEALKEFLTVEEVLGAAELALGKLEPIAKNALVDAAKARGEKLTKKAAWEQVQSTLEANGLLTRPDGKIRYLKRKKQAPKEIGPAADAPKQIEQ